MFTVNCECGAKLKAKDDLVGRTALCPKCHRPITINRPEAPIKNREALAELSAAMEPTAKPHAMPLRAASRQATEQGHNPNVQTINVNLPRRSSSLGITSLVLGALAFVICWIPFLGVLGVPLSALGLLLGILGVIVALTRKASGVGFPIGGAVVSGVALIIAISVNLAVFAGAAAVGEAVNEAVTEAERVGRVDDAATADHSASSTTTHGGPTADNQKRAQDHAARQSPPEPKWALATKTVKHGDIKIKVLSVSTGKVPLVNPMDESSSRSRDPLLRIRLRVSNLSKTKKLEYHTWAGGDFSILRRDHATLKDNFGNSYKRISFGGLSTPKGRNDIESIYPRESIKDVLVFELPIDGVEHLDLELPAENAGGKGMIRLRIPTKMINADE